jgi:hypothetical protein
VAVAAAAQAVDLLRRDDAPVARVAFRLDPPLAVPAAQGVEADAERLSRIIYLGNA